MKTSIRITGLIAVLLLTPAVGPAHGQGEGPSGDHGQRHVERGDTGMHMERMADRLDLSNEQRDELRTIHEANHPRMVELRQAMHEQREALREASRGGFDEDAAEAAAERLGELTTEMSLMRARMHADMNAMLDEEQLEKFRRHHEGRGEGHRGRMHGGEDEEHGKGKREEREGRGR